MGEGEESSALPFVKTPADLRPKPEDGRSALVMNEGGSERVFTAMETAE